MFTFRKQQKKFQSNIDWNFLFNVMLMGEERLKEYDADLSIRLGNIGNRMCIHFFLGTKQIYLVTYEKDFIDEESFFDNPKARKTFILMLEKIIEEEKLINSIQPSKGNEMKFINNFNKIVKRRKKLY